MIRLDGNGVVSLRMEGMIFCNALHSQQHAPEGTVVVHRLEGVL